MKQATKTRIIFNTILDGIDLYMKAFDRHRPIEYDYEELLAIRRIKTKQEKKHERRLRQQALRRLQQQGYIRAAKLAEKIMIELTEKGWRAKLVREMMTKRKALPKKQCCLVSFDIPESVSPVRDLLRSVLRSCDFELVHKSVWRSRYDVVDELRAFVKQTKSEAWIKIYIANEIRSGFIRS